MTYKQQIKHNVHKRKGNIVTHHKSIDHVYSLIRVVMGFRHMGHCEMVTPQSLQV